MYKYRILFVQGFIVAQFGYKDEAGNQRWYVCNRSETNTEKDFAVWSFSEENKQAAAHFMARHGHDFQYIQSVTVDNIWQENNSWRIQYDREKIRASYSSQIAAVCALAGMILSDSFSR